MNPDFDLIKTILHDTFCLSVCFIQTKSNLVIYFQAGKSADKSWEEDIKIKKDQQIQKPVGWNIAPAIYTLVGLLYFIYC